MATNLEVMSLMECRMEKEFNSFLRTEKPTKEILKTELERATEDLLMRGIHIRLKESLI